MTRATAADSASLSMVDAAYRDMHRRILDNIWAPGYQALEQEIALQLGMSRTPVREALIRLEKEGLVAVIPRRGMRVLPVSPTDMCEIYEILGALESAAAEKLAARKPTDAELEPLLVATRDMEKALAADDLDAWAKADESFHEQLVTMAGNKLLADAVFSHWDRAHRARMFTLRLRPKPVNSTQEHMALVERLREGDAAGAAAVNREHRQRASRELLSIFERFRLQQM
ncbi:GntR family transcriptional regulator [Paracidovorax sp. MALMAid1276]|uniref:GntR family transcriptional regulator n=1 Tax=Paracidovorax sp. MALMAid1276 TaxID=3411631 RepID=UPI003B998440